MTELFALVARRIGGWHVVDTSHERHDMLSLQFERRGRGTLMRVSDLAELPAALERMNAL